MATFRFKKKHEDAKISVPILSKTITKENLTDKDVEFLEEKFPGRYIHNFERIADVKEEEKPSKKPARKPRAKKA